jgi:hypothetical protein
MDRVIWSLGEKKGISEVDVEKQAYIDRFQIQPQLNAQVVVLL